MTLQGEKTFKDSIRKLKTTDPKHPDTWNPNYQDLINNDVYLKDYADTLQSSVDEIDQELDELRESDPVEIKEAVQLYWKYSQHRTEFEMFGGTYYLRGFTEAVAGAYTVAGDDSVDVESTADLVVGDDYVIYSQDNSKRVQVRVQEILDSNRFIAEENIGETIEDGFLACSDMSISGGSAQADSGQVYFAPRIDLETQIDAQVYVRHDKGSAAVKMYYHSEQQTEWAELDLDSQEDVDGTYTDYRYTLPVREKFWLRMQAEVNDISIRNIVLVGLNVHQLVRTPEVISPEDGDSDVDATVDLKATSFAPLYSTDSRMYREFKVIEKGGDWHNPEIHETEDADHKEVSLDPDKWYVWDCRDRTDSGEYSAWMGAQEFSTADIYVAKPSNISPAHQETDVPEQPVLEAESTSIEGASGTHIETEFRIKDDGGVVIYAGSETESDLLTHTVDEGYLEEGEKTYTWQHRQKYKIDGGGEIWSDWSDETEFTTEASFSPDMSDPENVGTEFGGGFAVSERVDKNGNPYILVCSGWEGDSWHRECDSNGDADQGGDGQMNWAANDDVVGADHDSDGQSNYEAMKEHHGTQNSPVVNFIENYVNGYNDGQGLGGYKDWYVPAQASTDDFEIYNTCGFGWGAVTEDESELADIFMYLLQGRDTNRDQQDAACYENDETEIDSGLFKFFESRPDNEEEGEHAFDADYYWSSTEDGSNGRDLAFHLGHQGTGAKSSNAYRVRAVRRVYI